MPLTRLVVSYGKSHVMMLQAVLQVSTSISLPDHHYLHNCLCCCNTCDWISFYSLSSYAYNTHSTLPSAFSYAAC